MHRHSHHFSGRGGLGRGGGGGGRFFGGRFGAGLRGGGAGMRAAKMVGSGELQLIILRLLSGRPYHGYEVIKAISEHSFEVYTPSPGMVYPALTYLEEMGYAAALADGTKKSFSLTPEGGEYLKQNRATADEVWNQLALYGRKLAHFQKQFTEEEDVADRFGGDPRGAARGEWHKVKAEFRSLREELKAALYDKIDASLEEKQRILQVLRQAIADIRGNS